jgi:5-methylcytosine-specific restriction enzyme subunit McrC
LIPPIECVFDEFTDDIEINRLLKAAVARLGSIRLRSGSSNSRLRSLGPYFANVARISYDPRNLPEVRYDRQTERYRGAVEFARLILKTRSLDSRSGEVSGAAFLLNMATVFEDFVVIALRDSLKVSRRVFPQQAAGRPLHLDEDRRLKLEPDLSWWVDGKCRFVGDVKYKRTKSARGMQHPDLYQMLAYTTATARRHGLLIYAAGEEPGTTHRIVEADKEVTIRSLDLDVQPAAVLQQIAEIAELIKRQAASPAWAARE